MVEDLPDVLRALAPATSVMFVGHEPDMSELVGELVGRGGSARIRMKRGACCCLDLREPPASGDVPWSGAATLCWLLTARQLAVVGSASQDT